MVLATLHEQLVVETLLCLYVGTELTDCGELPPEPQTAEPQAQAQVEAVAQNIAHIDIGITPAESPKKVRNVQIFACSRFNKYCHYRFQVILLLMILTFPPTMDFLM